MPPSFYLIDGHAQIYRSYYAPFANLSSPSGEPTRATHVFCQSFLNLIRTRRPDYLLMALDTSDKTVFRRDIYSEYKAKREPPPEDLAPQAGRIVQIVETMGVPTVRVPGFEADDIIATMVERLADDDVEVFLVSKDKDLWQLLSPKVHMYDMAEDEVRDVVWLTKKMDVTPEQAIDVQILAGDSVDNIPGVRGIGIKTAVKLINKYGTAERVLAHADELTPKQCENVKAFAPQLAMTRQLVTLRRDVDVPLQLEECRFRGVDVEAVRPLFEELGLKRLREQLDALAGEPGAVVDVAGAGQRPTPTGSYELVDTPGALDRLAGDLRRRKVFAFDTETTGLNPVHAALVGLSFSWEAGQGHYVPVRASVGRTLPLDAIVSRLGPVLADDRIRKVGHNIKYDLVVLRQVGIEVAGVDFDTMIASFILEPLRRSHSLDATVADAFGHRMIPISDLIGKGRNQITIDQVDTARVGEYAAEDADYTWRLFERLGPRIDADRGAGLFRDTEMPLVAVLAEMENNGIALDTDLLGRMSNDLAERLRHLEREIHRAAGHPFNIGSPQQLAGVLFDEQGLPAQRRTKTGRSTDAETLETLKYQTSNPIPDLVLQYRELAKLKSTYVDALPELVGERTGRIHTSFHQTGAITGRLSSSDPNLQNIPVRTEQGRRVRAAFVAGDAENVILTADYSQIELRILAHFSKDEALRQAFAAGQDIHTFVAAQVNGVAPENVTREQRTKAKAVNFGIIYGQTAFRLGRSLGISVAEAKAFISTYFLRYPGIRMFIDDCVSQARRDGYVETLLGRRRPVPELRSRNRQQVAAGERVAVNTVIQGSAADLIKRAMIDIHRTIRSEKRPSRMLLQIHDELLFEVPARAAEAEAEMIRRKMIDAIRLEVPIVVDVGWGPNWLESK